MNIEVECRIDHDGERIPARLHFDHRTVDVIEVVDRWLAKDHRYFKLKGGDDALYILRHDVAAADAWQIVVFNKDTKAARQKSTSGRIQNLG